MADSLGPVMLSKVYGEGLQRHIIAWLIGGLATCGIVAQYLLAPRPTTAAVAAGIVGTFLVTVSFLVRGRLLDVISGYRLASVLLALLAGAAALGTLIVQNGPADFYAFKYGRLSAIVLTLRLDDLFHSLWFANLLGLLIAGLITSAVRRWPLTFCNAGFFAVHLGLVVTLVGAGLSSAFTVKGRVDLHVGAPAENNVAVTNRNQPTGDKIPLGATLQLEKLDVDRYREQPRVAFYQPAKNGSEYELKASFESRVGTKHRLPGDASFRIQGYYPDLLPNERTVEATGTPAFKENSPKHLLKVENGEPHEVRVGETSRLEQGVEVKVVRFFPHFSYNIEEKVAVNLSDSPVNPALEIEVGGARRFLFANMPGFRHSKTGPDLTYVFSALGHKILPSEPRHVAVSVEVTEHDAKREEIIIAGAGHGVAIGGGGFLALEMRDSDVKSFRSHVLVNAGMGSEERHETIAVNSPVSVAGWSLYQANFHPQDPSYSGLEAVRDPGVSPVFVGFGLIFFGVAYVVFIQPRLRRRREA